eukprot:10647828-Lingulodinium_polyedra.AAC.1
MALIALIAMIALMASMALMALIALVALIALFALMVLFGAQTHIGRAFRGTSRQNPGFRSHRRHSTASSATRRDRRPGSPVPSSGLRGHSTGPETRLS